MVAVQNTLIWKSFFLPETSAEKQQGLRFAEEVRN